METHAGVPEAVVIPQDEQVEIHVQAVAQSGQRHVDVRIWRQGPSGFTPSRSALLLDLQNLNALSQGIRELLDVSRGGRQVARIVWDHAEGQRLRAEIDPFGTRYLARLGFWHRVRSSWRPADDGVALAADRLPALLDALQAFRPWMSQRRREPEWVPITAKRDILDRWPAPGGDWITIEPDRVAFHPRGVRITAVAQETENGPIASLQQWRRDDSLWVTETVNAQLGITDVEDVLTRLSVLASAEGDATEELVGSSGRRLRLSLRHGDVLRLEAAAGEEYRPWLVLPAVELPRFGRLLAQTWGLIVSLLSDLERSELQILHEVEQAVELEEEPEPVVQLTRLIPAPVRAGEPQRDPTWTPAAAETAEVPQSEGAERPTEDSFLQAEGTLDPTSAISLGTVRVGRQSVAIDYLPQEPPHLALRWDGQTLELPAHGLDRTLADLRGVYYDALRGRRRSIAIVGAPDIHATVQSRGAEMVFVVEGGAAGSSLVFPANEAPAFLDSMAAAMARNRNAGSDG